MYDDVGSGSTAIFCRSTQFSEAAILLSCQQGEHFSPVINLDLPPCSIPEYKEKLKLYRKHETERNLLAGTRKARQDLVHQNQDAFSNFRALDTRCQELLAELEPFRGWLKRRQALARLTSSITWKNVVFLFEPEPFDLVVPLSCYYNHRDELVEEPSLLLEDVPRILLLPIEAPVPRAGDQFNLKTYRDLDELCSLSWQEFGPTGRPPEQWLESIAGEEGPILSSLYLAWQQGVPLRLHQRDPHEPVPSLEQMADQANERIASEEVVLVEEGVGMEGLLAVAYARHHRASFLVSPQPDLMPVNQALQAFWEEQQQDAAGYLSLHKQEALGLQELSDDERQILQSLPLLKQAPAPDVSFSPKRFLNELKGLLSGWRTHLNRIREAATASVPAWVVERIGDRPLTVFTSGLPYGLVGQGQHGWSRKPIGHVVGEPTLLILDEIFGAPKAESQADFAVILDTEPYGGQEAADTLNRLGKHFTHSLIFSRSQASFLAILTLGARLPLNLLYINTHGFAQGIQLGAQLPETFGSDSEDEGERVRMDSFKISQWLTMPTRPVVINNSCLSWIGVGRAFLAAGARGYLGTLWAVDASSSAQLASHVLGLALQEDRPLAEALAMTPADSFTKEAYILIGTLRTSVAHAGPEQGSLSQSRLIEAVTVLLECLEATGRDQRRFDLVPVLYSNYRVALEQLLANTADGKNPLAAINDIYLKELRVLLSMTVNTLPVDQRERELIETIEAGLLRSGHGPEADLIVPNHTTLRRELLFLKSMYYSRLGDVTTALRMLEDSSGNDEIVSVEQLLLLSSLYRSLAEFTKALFHASHAVILARRNGNRMQLVKALGHHVQLLYRVEEYEQADVECLEAIDLARKIEDRHEEVTLLQDRVRILFGLHEDQKALEMARESLRCARSFYDDLAETASLGLITIALMRLGDLPQAREAAEDGLQLACDLGDPHQQAEFLMDLGRISAIEEQPAHAVDAFLKAMQLYGEQGNGEKAIIATKFLFDAYVQMGSWNQAVLQLEQLAKAMDGMSDNLRTPTTDFITTSLKRIATEAPVADARSVIHDLWQRMMNRYAMKPPYWHANFVCNVCAVMEFWLDGLQDKAVEVAACLDEDSQNYFDFASFVANPRLPSGASASTGGCV